MSSIEDISFDDIPQNLENKSAKKPDFIENVIDEVKDTIKEKGSEIIEDISEWVKKNYESLKTVASSWKEDVMETIKLKTIDKWRVVSAVRKENKFIFRKEKEIGKFQDVADEQNKEIEKSNISKSKEIEAFDSALLGIQDQELRALFNKNKTEKIGKDIEKTLQETIELNSRIDSFLSTQDTNENNIEKEEDQEEEFESLLNELDEELNDVLLDFATKEEKE